MACDVGLYPKAGCARVWRRPPSRDRRLHRARRRRRALRGDVVLFEEAFFDATPLTRGDIVVGGIGYVHRALARLSLAIPQIESIPAALSAFAGRRSWRGPMREARAAVTRGEALFVKPTPVDLKSFTGQPIRAFADLIATAHVDDDHIVDFSELTPFVNEYRAFVLHGDIVGLRHYKGDPLVFPDPQRIRAMVSAYDDGPASYALDVGVVEDGRTLVVEVNDSYATGDYGLPPTRYAAVIAARWAELRRIEAPIRPSPSV